MLDCPCGCVTAWPHQTWSLHDLWHHRSDKESQQEYRVSWSPRHWFKIKNSYSKAVLFWHLLLQKIIQRTGLLRNHLLHLPNIVYRNTIYTTLSLDKLCETFMIIMADDVFLDTFEKWAWAMPFMSFWCCLFCPLTSSFGYTKPSHTCFPVATDSTGLWPSTPRGEDRPRAVAPVISSTSSSFQ